MDDKVATAYGLDEQETEIRSLDKAGTSVFSNASRPTLRPIQSPIIWEISPLHENKADGARDWPLTIQCRRQE